MASSANMRRAIRAAMAALAFSSSSASSTRAYAKFYHRSALPQLQLETKGFVARSPRT
jgi:hypothetical protein